MHKVLLILILLCSHKLTSSKEHKGIGLASISTQRYDVETTNKHNENNDLEKRTENSVEDKNLNEGRNVEDAVIAKKSKHSSVKSKHHHSKSGSKNHKKGESVNNEVVSVMEMPRVPEEENNFLVSGEEEKEIKKNVKY